MFVLVSVALVALLRALRRDVRVWLTVAIVGSLAWHGVKYGLDRGIFNWDSARRETVAVCDYIARRLPSNAIFLSVSHSGSIRYYAGRITVRYDWIPPSQLDTVIQDLRDLGYHPYIVLEQWDEPQFQSRFAGASALGALDWPAVARLYEATKVSIYDPADRQAMLQGKQMTSEIIH